MTSQQIHVGFKLTIIWLVFVNELPKFVSALTLAHPASPLSLLKHLIYREPASFGSTFCFKASHVLKEKKDSNSQLHTHLASDLALWSVWATHAYRSLLKLWPFSFGSDDVETESWRGLNPKCSAHLASQKCWPSALGHVTSNKNSETFESLQNQSVNFNYCISNISALNMGLYLKTWFYTDIKQIFVCALANFCNHTYRNDCMYFSYMKQTTIQAHNYLSARLGNYTKM